MNSCGINCAICFNIGRRIFAFSHALNRESRHKNIYCIIWGHSWGLLLLFNQQYIKRTVKYFLKAQGGKGKEGE